MGLGDFISSAAGVAGNLLGAKQSYRYSKKEAKKNRKFQERMSRHSYRYAMEDMKAAGLNPILAYQQGGASTPGGATAATPDLSNLGDTLNTGRKVGSEKALLKANIDLATQSTAKQTADARKATLEGDIQAPKAFLAREALALAEAAKNTAKKTKHWLDENERKRTSRETRAAGKKAASKGKGVPPGAN